jgi:hypothetical protein
MADGYDACTVESSALPGVSRLSNGLGRLAVLQYWVACMHTSWMDVFPRSVRSGVVLDDSHLSSQSIVRVILAQVVSGAGIHCGYLPRFSFWCW